MGKLLRWILVLGLLYIGCRGLVDWWKPIVEESSAPLPEQLSQDALRTAAALIPDEAFAVREDLKRHKATRRQRTFFQQFEMAEIGGPNV